MGTGDLSLDTDRLLVRTNVAVPRSVKSWARFRFVVVVWVVGWSSSRVGGGWFRVWE